MGRSLLIAVAALVVAGGGVLGYGLTRTTGGGPIAAAGAAVTNAITGLDAELKGQRALVDQRAETLSTIPTIKATVSVDATSAMEQVGKEIAFKPERGEVIELGQVAKGGQPATLLLLPENGVRASQSGKIGSFTELAGDQLLLTKTLAVVPADPTTQNLESAYVTVSRMLSAKPTVDALVSAGVSGRLELGGKALPFGTAPADAAEVRPIPSLAGGQLVVALPMTKGTMPIGVVGGGAGVAGLGLVLVLFGMLAGKQRTGMTAAMSAATPTVDPVGATQLTGPGMSRAQSAPGDPGASLSGSSLAGVGPGSLVGRWEIVKRLGSGGMADVFLAHAKGEAGFEKLVAIKVMHAHLARNDRAVELFLDEARLAARVTHPNVVQIQDLGKIGNDYVIVMEYVEGVDLERLLIACRTAGRQVPVNVALGILCRVCDGLHAAHTAKAPDGSDLGIIHRDVKAANVLVSKQGGVKVVDFGIAKASTQVHMTVAGETKGTPSMMSPEQRVGDQVDVRADVYSLGAVAYEVLTGNAVNLDLAALAHLGIDNWPHLPNPSSLRPELPPELDALLLTTMAYERERRPGSCAELETRLEAVMKAHNLSASDKDIGRWVDGELRLLVG